MKTETKMLGIGMTERNVPKVMSGAKTQTRRTINPQPIPIEGNMLNESKHFGLSLGNQVWEWNGGKGTISCKDDLMQFLLDNARHQIGDRLYVKEALQKHYVEHNGDYAMYKTDRAMLEPLREWARDTGEPWKQNVIPARYMPRSAARTFIEITDVKCERIQSISVDDAIAEGITKEQWEPHGAVKAFKELWDDTNGKDAWERNNWVLAYTFKLAEAPQ